MKQRFILHPVAAHSAPTVLGLLLCAALAQAQSTTTGWQLVWSDEFNGAANSPPNPKNWNFDLGDGGWGNGEAEVYTSSLANAFQDGQGRLVIRVIRDSSGNYTSARMRTGSIHATTDTADLSWKYGLIEARIRLPYGAGVWPAFWALGENFAAVGWPTCGEIDVLENFGANFEGANVIHGSLHGPGQTDVYTLGNPYSPPFSENYSDDFHIFGIQWAENSVAFFVDGAFYQTFTPSSLAAGTPWEFNAPFFLLLNVAIGGQGTFLGTPTPSTPFPQDMLVDWVRVYRPVNVSATTPVVTPGSIVNAASYLGTLGPGALASLFGANLAGGTYQGAAVLNSKGGFVNSAGGVSVSVNGVNAPLTYVSPGQINFQIPWETAAGSAAVQVTRGGIQSNAENITITPASPAFFIQDYTTGAVFATGCSRQAGSVCVLWATGLGPKNSPQQADQDGAPVTVVSPLSGLEVPGGTAACQLSVGGQPARVNYCGAAPGEIIDQINFVYPSITPLIGGPVPATLTVRGVTITFQMPGPGA